MKFADCEESVVKSNDGKTYTEIKSLEIFDKYAEDLEETEMGRKRFIFNGYVIVLIGIPENYRVYFWIDGNCDLENVYRVGERILGEDHNISGWLYSQMMKAIRQNYIIL